VAQVISTASVLASDTAVNEALLLLDSCGFDPRLTAQQPALSNGQPGLKTYAFTMAAAVAPDPTPEAPVLTLREYEVLSLVSEGNSNSEIGDILGLGHATIKTHVQRIMRKLGAVDRANATVIGLRAGLIGGVATR
jgi:DNA-binding CsgD family transcriptional regulator